MQTNCLLQQNMLASQNPVSSYCLMPPLRFALLFLFLSHHTVAPYWDKPRPPVGHKAPSAHDKSLNQYLSLEKGAKSLFFFFFFWRIWRPLRRCLVALTTVQIKGSLMFFFFFFYVQQHLETLDRLVYSFSKDHRRKADFKTLKTDAHYVGCGIVR